MKNRYQCLVLFCMLSALFTGCAGIQNPAVTSGSCTVISASTRKDAEAIETLRYFSRMRGLQSEELGREYNAALQAFAKQKSATNRIKLAFLLSLPNGSFR